MSYHRLSTKPLNSSLSAILKRATQVGLGVGAFTPVLVFANPTGGQVAAGQASIATPNANKTVIDQTSQSAIINWQSFSIGSGQYVQFLQPSSSSVVLNRVVGGNASNILGSLTANGQVFLINPNGIFFGKSASLDVQGLFASTDDISDSNFLSGHYLFEKGSSAPDAQVVNQGTIRANAGGYVVLAGDYSANAGLVQAQSGHIILASGSQGILTLSGNSLVSFVVDQATLAKFAGVANSGGLFANGGTIVMTADVANALKATVVNNSGLIEANSIAKQSGNIFLTAVGGDLADSGTLEADATANGVAGGNISLVGDANTVLSGTGKISATGMGAAGGTLELSGSTVNVRGTANLGKGGNLLLDPGSISISAGNKNSHGTSHNTTSVGKVGTTFIDGQLNAGANVTLSATKKIFNASNAHAISATGLGNLAMKVGTGGAIKLKGMNIRIGGAFAATFGYGSFGYLKDKSVTLNANEGGGSFVDLAPASTSVGGKVIVNSARATAGNVIINAKQLGHDVASSNGLIALRGTGSVNVNAAVGNSSHALNGGLNLSGKSVIDTALVHTKGNVTIAASGGAAFVDKVIAGSSADHANINLSATGGALSAEGQLVAGGVITVTDNNAQIVLARVDGSNGVTITNSNGRISAGMVGAQQGNIKVTTNTQKLRLGSVDANGGSVTITNTGGSDILTEVNAQKNINLTAGVGEISFRVSNGLLPMVKSQAGNVLITAPTITQKGTNLDLSAASGNLTVNGKISLPTEFSAGSLHKQVPHNLTLAASKSVRTNQNIAVPGAVTITANHLFYTGTGKNFSVSAADGNLTLQAPIGSAASPVKYNVSLLDQKNAILVERSIYAGSTVGGHTAANIFLTETGHSGTLSGVLIGNDAGGAVTITTPGKINIRGWNVGVGHVAQRSVSSHVGPITILDRGNHVLLSASGNTAHGGNVGIQPGNASVHNAAQSTGILIQDTVNNITLKGERVSIRGGRADAYGTGGGVRSSATASANVAIRAGTNIIIQGGSNNNGAIDIQGGSAFAVAGDSAPVNSKATAKASIVLKAGTTISLTATDIEVSGGYGNANASANEGTEHHAATGNANTTIIATGNVTLNTGTNPNGEASIRGGYYAGSDNHATALGDDTATAAANATTTITSTLGSINIAAQTVDISAGVDAGKNFSGNHYIADASGEGAKATYTVTADTGLTAGAAGITIKAGNASYGGFDINGGDDLLNGTKVYAANGSASASANVSSQVKLSTTGNITISTPQNINITAGNNAASGAGVEGANGAMGHMTGNGNVTLSAANITLGSAHATKNVDIYGGGDAGGFGSMGASNGGQATLSAQARVNLTATTGNITITANNIDVAAGYGADEEASFNFHPSYGGARFGNIVANGGKYTRTADAGISLSAPGNISLTGTGSVTMLGGSRGAEYIHTQTKTDGSASVTGKGSVNANAGGSFTAVAHHVYVAGGSNVTGYGDATAGSASSTGELGGGHITIKGSGGVEISAAKVVLQGAGSASVFGGRAAAISGDANAYFRGGISITGSAPVVVIGGTVSITGNSHGVDVAAGSDAVRSARASVHHGGGASIRGSASVDITAATSLNFTASNGYVEIEGGNEAAAFAHAYAQYGGSASVQGHAAVTAEVNTGNLTITGKEFITVAGGSQAVQGVTSLTRGPSNGSVTHNASSSSFVRTTHHHITSYASAAASHSGARAGLSGAAGVTLSASGTLTVGQTGGGEISIRGGNSEGRYARASASQEANASVFAAAHVSLTGATVALTGANVRLQAGDRALLGAPSSSSSHITVHHKNAGGTSFTGYGDTHFPSQPTAAHNDADAFLGADVGVTVSGGTVTLNASNGEMTIQGGTNAARSGHVSQGHAAGASINAGNNVEIKASGALTLTGKTGIFILGAGGAQHAAVKADSDGYAAIFTDGSVSMAGAAVTLSAPGGVVQIQTGYGSTPASHANVSVTGPDAQANLTTAGNVFISAATFNVNAGSIEIATAFAGGIDAVAKAKHQSEGLLRTNDSIDIDATTISLTATTGGVEIQAGYGALNGASVKGSSDAFASINSRNNVSLEATGAFNVTAAGSIHIGAGNGANAAVAHGTSGAAIIENDSSVSLSGASLSLTAGGDITIAPGGGAAQNAKASAASSGYAAITANNNVDITATTGALSLTADGEGISLFAAGNGAHSAHAHAASSGYAVVKTDGSLTLSGATVTLTAPGGVDIEAGYGAANGAVAFASSNALGSINTKNNVSITATGALTITAGESITIDAGGSDASHASAQADGLRNHALVGTNGQTGITAASVTLNAGNSINFFGGSRNGYGAHVKASHGGSAGLVINGGIDITASTGFNAVVKGTALGGEIKIISTGTAGHGASLAGYGPGAIASLMDNEQTSITVTKAGGALTLFTSSHKGANVVLQTGYGNGASVKGYGEGGSVTAAFNDGISLRAPGAVTIRAKHGSVFIANSGGTDVRDAVASAESNGKDSVKVNDNVSIRGGTLTLAAGTYTSGSPAVSYGGDILIDTHQAGTGGLDAGAYGGSAAVTLNAQVNLAATGLLSIHAAHNLNIGKVLPPLPSSVNDDSIGVEMRAFAVEGGKAAVGVNTVTEIQGGTVTLTGGNNLSITSPSGGILNQVVALGFGTATLNVESGIDIAASGSLSARAGHSLDIMAGFSEAALTTVGAEGPRASATFTADNGVTLSGNIVDLSAASFIEIGPQTQAGEMVSAMANEGGNATLNVNAAVNVNAVQAASLLLTGSHGGGSIFLTAGSEAGAGAKALNSYGGAVVTTTVKAGLGITVSGPNGTLLVSAGKHVGAEIQLRTGAALGNNSPAYGSSSAGPGHSSGNEVRVVSGGPKGHATETLSAGINLSATGALTLAAGASGNLLIGSAQADHDPMLTAAEVQASYGGVASLKANAVTRLSGATVTLTAGENVTITGASFPAFSASVDARFGGSANANVQAGTNINVAGSFKISAGNDIFITANGLRLPAGGAAAADVTASYGGVANLTINAPVKFTANGMNFRASHGSISIDGAEDVGGNFIGTHAAEVNAQGSDAQANLSVDQSVDLTAAGAVSLRAATGFFIFGGNDAGYGMHVSATSGGVSSSGRKATATINAGVNLNMGGSFTARTQTGSLSISAGGDIGRNLKVFADGAGNTAVANVNGGVTINAPNMIFKASNGSVFVGAGRNLGIGTTSGPSPGTIIAGSKGGLASDNVAGSVKITSLGNISLTAGGGNVFIRAAHTSHESNHIIVDGSDGGTGVFTEDGSVQITGGGNLAVMATGLVGVVGGTRNFASANGAFGSADVTLNDSVTLKAGEAMSLAAGSDLEIVGGEVNGILAQGFQSSHGPGPFPPGNVKGVMNASVTLQAGSNATLTAGGNLDVEAGAGAVLGVGAVLVGSSYGGSVLTGHAWKGGVVNLSGNVGVSVTAGKALTLTAGSHGSGSLEIQALRRSPVGSIFNVAMVDGGSGNAIANVSLDGNATLTAGTNLTLNAAGNASIVGGALHTVLALHTAGDVTVTGSADAILHAGHNVLLNNIQGSLTVAAANAGNSASETEVDTHADFGTAIAVGHADAVISAGNSVMTVNAIGHGLNMLAGSIVLAAAHGSADIQHVTATANADITGGRGVRITADGNLTMFGGRFTAAEVSGAGLPSNATHSADLHFASHTAQISARADIDAGSRAILTIGGNALIAGGDGAKATVKFNALDGASSGGALAVDNVGVGIQAGHLSLNVAGDLKVRGGSGGVASVNISHGKFFTGSASVDAGANLTATSGGIAITVGGASASFLAGSGGSAKVQTYNTTHDSATGVVHSDLTIAVARNLTLTAAGNVTIAGGPAAQQFGDDQAGSAFTRGTGSTFESFQDHHSTTVATVSDSVKITATGAINVAQSGGDLKILGGSNAGSFTELVTAGSHDQLFLSLDTSVLVKAGGALSFAGAKDVTLSAGILPTFGTSAGGPHGGSGPYLHNSGSSNHIGVKIDSSVKLIGASVTVNNTGTMTRASQSSFIVGSLSGSFSAAVFAGVRTLGVPVSINEAVVPRGLVPQTQALQVRPLPSQMSFGGVKPLSAIPTTTVSGPAAANTLQKPATGVSVQAALQPLATLQSGSLVYSLTPVLEKADGAANEAGVTLFTPVMGDKSYSDSFAGACVALVVSRSGGSLCTGGK